MRVGIVGIGAVGARVARQIVAGRIADGLVIHDLDTARVADVLPTLGPTASVAARPDVEAWDIDVLVVAVACGRHAAIAKRAARAGIAVVSTSDSLDEVDRLAGLDAFARNRRVPILMGAGFAPGLTCVLARHLGSSFDAVDEVHVATHGTGGPACARQHHRALSGSARDWRAGEWVRRPGGSGRELLWFPEPVGGADCYRAALADSVLLQPAFPRTRRITSRMSATRQDRFTAWLPMLSPPHVEGGLGAVRVEVHGRIDGSRVTRIAGAVEHPAIGAAAVAATAVETLASGEIAPGASGLGPVIEPLPFLRRLKLRGIEVQLFEGLTV